MSWWTAVAGAAWVVTAVYLIVQIRRMSWFWEHAEELTPIARARETAGMYRRTGYFQLGLGTTLATMPALPASNSIISAVTLGCVGTAMIVVGVAHHQGRVARRVVPFVPVVKQIVFIANATRYNAPWPPQEKPNVRRA
jgi:hypothetical protein